MREACDEYLKRIRAFADVDVVEVKDEKICATLTPDMAVARESERLCAKIRGGTLVALDPGGKALSSRQFAALIGEIAGSGRTPLTFVVGGSHGLSREIRERAAHVLSFSKMTFPHQLFRVMLTEQIYRAFTILNHRTYHK